MRVNYSTYFKRHHCSFDRAEFNALKIIKKYEDLTSSSRLKMFLRWLIVRLHSNNPFPAPD